MSGADLSGYVTVAERLVTFHDRHPQGRIQATLPVVRQVGDRTFLEVQATVWRDLDDPLPAVAAAWEPFPGRTAFTRDSEAMNAETSAIGRALALVGIGVQRGLATLDDVERAAREAEAAGQEAAARQNRRRPRPAPVDEPPPDAPRAEVRSPSQLLRARIDALDPKTRGTLRGQCTAAGIPTATSRMSAAELAQVSAWVDQLDGTVVADTDDSPPPPDEPPPGY